MRLDIHHKQDSLSNFYYSASLSLYIIPLLNTDLTVGGLFLGKNTQVDLLAGLGEDTSSAPD